VGTGASTISADSVALVLSQTATLQYVVYKYHVILLHGGSFLYFTVGGSQITPSPGEAVAQMLKRAGKWMCRSQSVFPLKFFDGVADGATAGVVAVRWLKLFPLRM
jgi:hypothetical protein